MTHRPVSYQRWLFSKGTGGGKLPYGHPSIQRLVYLFITDVPVGPFSRFERPRFFPLFGLFHILYKLSLSSLVFAAHAIHLSYVFGLAAHSSMEKMFDNRKRFLPEIRPTASSWILGKASSFGLVAVGRFIKSICLICSIASRAFFYYAWYACDAHPTIDPRD